MDTLPSLIDFPQACISDRIRNVHENFSDNSKHKEA